MIWPKPLLPGGTIGICSPAGPSPDGAIERGAEALRRRGYAVKIAPNAAQRHPDFDYLAGTETQRADDLNALIYDDTIDLILCARGGFGAGKILDLIDYAALKNTPKPLVGYSDITALNLAIAAQAGVVSFSGIMATAGDGFGEDTLHPFSEASFFQATSYHPSQTEPLILADAQWRLLRGEAHLSGPLFPICLTLLESLVATKYAPDLTGAILLIEDVHEELYAIDRALTQFRLAGILEKLSGVLIGSFNGWDSDKNAQLAAGVEKLVLEQTPARISIAAGIPYGHIPRRFTVPVGAVADVNTTEGKIVYASV
jgi:muramoyltetrapeptide carboxypeptidase